VPEVGIVVDSSSCFPRELAKQYNIRIAPNRVIVGKTDYRDQTEISMSDFWKIFDSSTTPITTSIVSPGDFLDIFKKLSRTTDSIACFVLSQKLSGTMNSAIQARELALAELPNLKIEIIDSKTSIGALSYIALEAARLARAGSNLAEVIDEGKKIIPRAKYLLVLETAKYIMRIGRSPADVQKAVGQANFNPVMGVVRDTGMVDMLGKEDTMAEAKHRAIDLIQNYADMTKPLHVMLHYSRDEAEVKDLEREIVAKYNCAELYTSEFSPVVVAALGTSVGIAFYS
jgi:DegV family protein with EDD domain